MESELECQRFTGFTDRDGKKIYEGDHVRIYDTYSGIVVWDADESVWGVDYPDLHIDGELLEELVTDGCIVVIGDRAAGGVSGGAYGIKERS